GVALRDVQFSPTGKLIGTCGADEVVRVHRAEDGETLRRFDGPGSKTGGLAWAPNGRFLAALSGGGAKVAVWDVQTGSRLFRIGNVGFQGRGLVWSPDGKWLATTSGTALKLWNGGDGSPGPDFRQSCSAVDWNATGRYLVANNFRKTIVIDGKTQQVMRVFDHHHAGVRSIAMDPAGRYLASSSIDQTLHLWDIDRGCLLWIAVFLDEGRTVVFSPTGELLYSAPGAEEQFAYLVERAENPGRLETLSADQFERLCSGKPGN
ncbi:MAG: hypothetical protein GXP27_04025, partial [Planctomycetes bacterium]|nr:hypothetical protein [Planctomycetota bacterium]